MGDSISQLWLKLEPLVTARARKLLDNIVASGGTTTAHSLSGALHTGTLADAQAPQFLKLDGSRSLLGNLPVGSGITIDGVDIDQFKLAYDLHIANPSAHHAAFIGLTDSSGVNATPNAGQRITLSRGDGIITQVVGGSSVQIRVALASASGLAIDVSQNLAIADSVAGAGLTISSKVLAVGAGAGITVSTDAVALTTPGTLAVGTANNASGSHTHAISASSNPGAATQLLKTDVAGNLTLVDLDLTPATEGMPLTITAAALQSNPLIRVISPAATGFGNGRALVSQVSGETHPRLVLHTDGMLGMGAGAIRPDVFISRSAAQTLRISGDGAGAEAGNLVVAGWGAFGDSIVPSAALDARSSTEQLRLRYDASNYARFMVGGGGSLEVQPTGELILSPKGRTVRPANPYETNLGTIQKKWLSIHGAELWIETLVAQETQATIGGRVLVGPTSILDSDLSAAATSLLSRYPLALGDIVRMEADGKVEFMQVGAPIQNLARNASFEDWTAGLPNLWSKDVSATVSQLTADPGILPHARRAAQLSNGRLWQDIAGLTVGTSYVITARLRVAPGLTARLRTYDGGGFSNPSSTTVTGDGLWQLATVVRTAPAGGSIRVAIEETAGTPVDVDAVLVEAGTVAGPFRMNTADAGGTYQYNVTRNLDGTGANDWWAGDAIFNMGQAGNGFIDLYSLRGVKSASQAGPAIALNVRNSSTFNDWTEHAALGNLKGLYDYGTDVYGVAVGKYSPTTSWLGADATNGVRIMRGSVTKGRWFADGSITIGEESPSQANLRITSNRLALRVNTVEYITLDVSVPSVRVSDPGGASYVQLSGGDVQLFGNGAQRIRLLANGDIAQGTNVATAAGTRFLVKGTAGAAGEAGETLDAGDLLIGRTASGKANLFYDDSAGRLNIRGGTTVQAYVDSDGSIGAAGGALSLGASGMTFAQGVSNTNRIRWLNGASTITHIGGYVSGGAFMDYQATTAGSGGTVAAHELRALATSQEVVLTVRAQNSTGDASGLSLAFGGTTVLRIFNDGEGLKSNSGLAAWENSDAGAGIVRARDIQAQQSNGVWTDDQSMVRAIDNNWVRLAEPAAAWGQGVYVPTNIRVDRHLFVGLKQLPANWTTGADGQIRAANLVAVTGNSSDPNYPLNFAATGKGILAEATNSGATTYITNSAFGQTQAILWNCSIVAETNHPYNDNQVAYTTGPGSGSTRAGAIMFTANGGVMRFMVSPVSAGANQFVDWDANGGTGPEVMNLARYSGYLHASAWFYESDERSKQDVRYVAEDKQQLAEVRGKLRRLTRAVANARYRGDATGRLTTSLIAQQVKEAFPEMVMMGESGYHAVATTELIPYLVLDNAEQQEEIDELRRRIERLEQRA